jgi:hypothetical protein
MPMQLLYSGFRWQPNILLDENICSNEFVPHSLGEEEITLKVRFNVMTK